MKKGFTLIELLISIAIVFMLASVVFVSVVTSEKPAPKPVYMNNEQIIAETKKCYDAGMDAIEYPYGNLHIEKITCRPKR